MSYYMPSVAYVARALHSIGSDTEWDDESPEDQAGHMAVARVAIDAIQSWQRSHKPSGLQRYRCEPTKSDKSELLGWAIHDMNEGGLTNRLGIVHDPLLAQQIIDDLNGREAAQQAKKDAAV